MFTSNNYKEIITKLKFLSKIQPGEKINTKPYLSIVNDDWITSLFRKFYNFESRSQTVQFINETISSTFQIIEQIKVTSKSIQIDTADTENILNNLYKDLVGSKNGIANLIKTYKADKIVICQLETIIENIDLFLQMNNVSI
jgi:hypothetical protein